MSYFPHVLSDLGEIRYKISAHSKAAHWNNKGTLLCLTSTAITLWHFPQFQCTMTNEFWIFIL